MFHIQVQEGNLGARGLIKESSRKWVEIPGTEFTYKNKTLKDGVDYHTLTYTARAIDFDNIIAPVNMVITGIISIINIIIFYLFFVKYYIIERILLLEQFFFYTKLKV